MLSMKPKTLERLAQLKMPIKSLEDNNTFYEANENGVSGEFSKATMGNTMLGEFVDSTRVELVSELEKLAARDASA